MLGIKYSPSLKVALKVIYSHGIKVFYVGVVFESLWYDKFEAFIRNKILNCHYGNRGEGPSLSS
jgi:hypothetical protein